MDEGFGNAFRPHINQALSLNLSFETDEVYHYINNKINLPSISFIDIRQFVSTMNAFIVSSTGHSELDASLTSK